MNEFRLSPEEQSEVAVRAVQILRQRVIGGISRLGVETIDTEFLAYMPYDVGMHNGGHEKHLKTNENWPEQLDVLSVSRVIEEAVRNIVQKSRPHVEMPYVSRACHLLIGANVMDMLSLEKREPIKLPPRIARVIEGNLEMIQCDIDSLDMAIDTELEKYTPDIEDVDKIALWSKIYTKLSEAEELKKKIQFIQSQYDLSSLRDEEQNFAQEQGESFDDTKFDNEGDDDVYGGGIGLLERDDEDHEDEDILHFEENIRLSPSEQNLRYYLPLPIRDAEDIFYDTYSWFTEGEEWKRESYNIRNTPGRYCDMLHTMIRRKKIIALNAEVTLIKETAKSEKTKKYGGPALGKIKKYLPVLLEEIEALEQKKQQALSENNNEQVSGEELKLNSLETNLNFLFESFDAQLAIYIRLPSERLRAGQGLERLQTTIAEHHGEITELCENNNFESNFVTKDIEGTQAPDQSCLSVEEYIQDPHFFKNFPTTLSVQKSRSENAILDFVQIEVPDWMQTYFTHEQVNLFYQEQDESASNDLQKMTDIEEVLKRFIRRKMFIYVTAYQKLGHNNEHPARIYLTELKQEIEYTQSALNTLINRIQWREHDDGVENHEDLDKYHDVYREIDALLQTRFHTLQAFVAANTREEEIIIGQKIMNINYHLEERRKEMSAVKPQDFPTQRRITIPGLGFHETHALKYIPPDTRTSEKEFFAHHIDVYEGGKWNSMTDAEVTALRESVLATRKMLLYFFLINRKIEIDMDIMSPDSETNIEQLVAEREELGSYENTYMKEIAGLLRNLANFQTPHVSTLTTPKHLRYQELYNEAMKVLAETDGKLAHIEGIEHESIYRNYWLTIQRYVRRFVNRIEIEEAKGNHHLIPAIQEEYNQDMHFIIQDIQQNLEQIEHQKKRTHQFTHYIHQVQERLFGKVNM